MPSIPPVQVATLAIFSILFAYATIATQSFSRKRDDQKRSSSAIANTAGLQTVVNSTERNVSTGNSQLL
jgi:hypothetical protein